MSESLAKTPTNRTNQIITNENNLKFMVFIPIPRRDIIMD